MATSADQRLLELLDKWLGSLELHLKYSSLDDAAYWKTQPWPAHERPKRWIVDLARQKTLTLKAQIEQRIGTGDATFSDALELMIFLANLVGSEHIERFIPLAEMHAEPQWPPTAAAAPAAQPPGATATRPRIEKIAADSTTATATREMPKYLAAKPRSAPPAGTPHVARAERKAATHARSRGKAPAKAAPTPPAHAAATDVARTQVLADARRLMQWGRKWYELPELIARMADRPSLPEVRRILKESRLDAGTKAGRD